MRRLPPLLRGESFLLLTVLSTVLLAAVTPPRKLPVTVISAIDWRDLVLEVKSLAAVVAVPVLRWLSWLLPCCKRCWEKEVRDRSLSRTFPSSGIL